MTNTATAIRKRDPPTSTSHPSVGLQSTHLKALEDLSSSIASRLSPPIIRSLLVSKEDLETYGYMMIVPPVEGGTRPTEEGELSVCERCKTEFVVGEIGEGAACWYHWGRARYGKEQGPSLLLCLTSPCELTAQSAWCSSRHPNSAGDVLRSALDLARLHNVDLARLQGDGSGRAARSVCVRLVGPTACACGGVQVGRCWFGL